MRRWICIPLRNEKGENMADEIFTRKEAAELLKCAPITVLRMIKRGELKAGRIGNRAIRITRSEIDKALQNRTETKK
jgi:excisionase family DNA binding protein